VVRIIYESIWCGPFFVSNGTQFGLPRNGFPQDIANYFVFG
jgi:hypothetical protein